MASNKYTSDLLFDLLFLTKEYTQIIFLSCKREIWMKAVLLYHIQKVNFFSCNKSLVSIEDVADKGLLGETG